MKFQHTNLIYNWAAHKSITVNMAPGIKRLTTSVTEHQTSLEDCHEWRIGKDLERRGYGLLKVLS
jgi:hypothetical protein